MTEPAKRVCGEAVHWKPERPRYSAPRVLLSWLAAAATLMFATWIVPGAHVDGFGSALIAALVIAILNALLPPLIAALRLPFMLLVGFGLVLVLDALMLMAADSITEGDLSVDSFWSALLVALVASAVGVGLDVLLGTADDDTYTFRVMQRIARRSGERIRSDARGSSSSRSTGWRFPSFAVRCATGALPRWPAGSRAARTADRVGDRPLVVDGRLAGRHPARLQRGHPGVPLGREGEATLMTCSAPPDCAEIERRRLTGIGLLRDGGASRGNLLSGEVDHLILTVSKIEAEKNGGRMVRGDGKEKMATHGPGNQ